MSSESESESEDGDSSPPLTSPEEPVDLLNLGGGAATGPSQQAKPAHLPNSSGTFFDLIGTMGQTNVTNEQTGDLSDLSDPAPYAPTTQPINSHPNIDLLGGFDSLSSPAQSSADNLLKPNTGLPTSQVSSSSSLVDQDFLNLMGSGKEPGKEPGNRPSSSLASSTENVLGGGTKVPSNAGYHSNHLQANSGRIHTSYSLFPVSFI